MEQEAKQRELEQLRERVRQLEEDLSAEGVRPWQATGYYTAYYATTGFILGGIGAMASLLLNVIGSLIVGQHPVRLIQVYLTFPLGESALKTENGLALAVGCCLYIGTGMLLGIPFYLILTRVAGEASFLAKLVLVSGLSLLVWLVNFYGILSWLQPLLFNGDWILREIPIPIAALTHLVFGWTMVLLYPLGLYTPYRLETE